MVKKNKRGKRISIISKLSINKYKAPENVNKESRLSKDVCTICKQKHPVTDDGRFVQISCDSLFNSK